MYQHSISQEGWRILWVAGAALLVLAMLVYTPSIPTLFGKYIGPKTSKYIYFLTKGIVSGAVFEFWIVPSL